MTPDIVGCYGYKCCQYCCCCCRYSSSCHGCLCCFGPGDKKATRHYQGGGGLYILSLLGQKLILTLCLPPTPCISPTRECMKQIEGRGGQGRPQENKTEKKHKGKDKESARNGSCTRRNKTHLLKQGRSWVVAVGDPRHCEGKIDRVLRCHPCM